VTPKFQRPSSITLNAALSCATPSICIAAASILHWRATVESDDGPLLVYDWAEGELLGQDKEAPDSALKRFRRLPVEDICRVIDQIYDAHRALAKAGWIAVDFYLGSIIYDFDARSVSLIDLDLYHAGPFTNKMGRMFGQVPDSVETEHRLG